MTAIIVIGVIVFFVNVLILWCAWAIPCEGECGDD